MGTFTETSCVNECNLQTVQRNPSEPRTPLRYGALGSQRQSQFHSFLPVSLHKSCGSSLHKVQFQKGEGEGLWGRNTNVFHSGPVYNLVITGMTFYKSTNSLTFGAKCSLFLELCKKNSTRFE